MDLEPIWDETATLDQITHFENEIGFPLPADYRAFLLKHNGGIPENNSLFINEAEGSTLFGLLYGFTEHQSGALFRNYARLFGYIPKEIIPIGDDAGGNRVCIGLSGKYLNKIYFHDHEEPKGKNLYYICDGFTEFLNRLEKTED